MPHSQINPKVFTLFEVLQSIQRTISARYTSTFWVKAEMNKLNHYSHSGHCYPELVEKTDGKIVAQMRANLWRSDYERINETFLQVLKEPLKEGIHILFNASIQFDPVYGLSLRIHDIDPSYSLGELEREKALTIDRLKKEQVFQTNKSVKLPLLPQRIAVISVETSKGYADFSKVIDGNPWGYKFFHMLFPALLQGDNAVDSILAQLNRIQSVRSHFDAVAIIRGGGGDVGLSCYNHYDLAHRVATFPLPVISGIGHSTNETVVEMVAHINAITPTALADLLIQQFHNFAVPLKQAIDELRRGIPVRMDHQRSEFRSLSTDVRKLSLNVIQRFRGELSSTALLFHRSVHHKRVMIRMQWSELRARASASAFTHLHKQDRELVFLRSGVKPAIDGLFKKYEHRIEMAEKAIELMDPVKVLKRGYSLTYHNGKLITSTLDVNEKDVIETRVSDGTIKSTVSGTENEQ